MGKKKSTSICGMSPADDRRYRAEDALRTLRRAEEIRNDNSLMRDVKKMASDEQKALEKFTNKPAGKKR